MHQAHVIEFTVHSQADFQTPIPLEEARLTEIAKEICKSSLAPHINVGEISLITEDDLFDYDLKIPMFNNSAELILNPQNVTVTFRSGRTSPHLKLISECTVSLMKLAVRHSIKRSVTSFSAQAAFDSQESYLGYMKQFTNGELRIGSGGIILFADLPDWEGEMRFATEKSMFYPNGIFVTGQASTSKGLSPEFSEAFAKRFEEVAKHHGLELGFTE